MAGAANPLKWTDNTGDVWPELLATLEQLNPERIILNTDENIAFAGGLHAGELAVLQRELGERWMKKTANEPMLAVEYVATKLPDQLKYYQEMQETVWAMVEEGFSGRIVDPGITSTEVWVAMRFEQTTDPSLKDLDWWFREQMQVLNLTTWFHPRVSVVTPKSFPGWQGSKDIIQEGDMLHIDFGISAMQMSTDTQHLAYVLRRNGDGVETDAPNGLKEGLKKSNRMQDIVLENMRPGLTGNTVLRQSLRQMELEGIDGQIYCHPIGDWGHDAGSVVGAYLFMSRSANLNSLFQDLPICPNMCQF